jgi:hypothetical protein
VYVQKPKPQAPSAQAAAMMASMDAFTQLESKLQQQQQQQQ